MYNQQQQLGSGSFQGNQKSTQAYKLFSEGYKPVGNYTIGLKSKQQDTIEKTENSKDSTSKVSCMKKEKIHLPSFLRLHNIMERQGMDDEKDIANVLKYANELPKPSTILGKYSS